MTKTIITLNCAILLSSSIFSQTGIKLKEGQQITQTTSSWVNTLIADKKFLKAGEDGRAKMVDSYNQDTQKGKIKGFGGTPYELTMVDFKDEGAKLSIAFQMGPYKFPMIVKNDTMLLYRNVGIIRLEKDVPVNANNSNTFSVTRDAFEVTDNTIGLGSQGVAIFPNNLQIGDILPMYEDIYISLPQSWDDKIRHNVVNGFKTVTKSEYGYFMGVDSKDGQLKSGFGTVTSTQMKAVYKTISTDAKVTISSSIYIMHHLFATVTDQVEMKIGKDIYTAYIVQSQRWTKNTEVNNWETEDAQLNANMATWEADFKERIAKKMTKKGITNELGYGVEHVTEWFVPGVGVVQFESVDSHGVITSKMTIDKIK